MLKDKVILLGVTGGIAAYKAADLASRLTKEGCDVHVILTQNATEFITPLTFETLTGNKCLTSTFDRNFEWDVKHVSLAKCADAVVIAPATANVIAKLAHGLADDMLTTTVLAATCPKLVFPAMNTAMYENPITQDNIECLRRYGFTVAEPASGVLACKDVGKGRLPDTDTIVSAIAGEIACPHDMKGLHVLVTAGPTCEAIDPVRYITNHSTGKMGYALAEAAQQRGANVTLVSGKTNLKSPDGVTVVPVTSAQDMYRAVLSISDEYDVIIKTAAVADYRPKQAAQNKIKKSDADMSIPLVRNPDILAELGRRKRDSQFLCGFSMETENLLANSADKLQKKNADMIVANSLTTPGAGFGADTNLVSLITREGISQLERMPKAQLAQVILDTILKLR
ncbi:phosphopantothenoylcysteine decarboxylase/phosphopantothenate--cysteine ligase [[Clostridium] methylpentosum DSM 5476]|uniref:Coenzyme A biosynthesis bifunctional protein CoaBC n=1 Tax=[Clostridium] methylpentosum DSM 5476 TaxID=537013 RepID=C0EFK8_9FIRM|nr:phosphopantothenoylcysteine decarboxylase/phosphopantothenate--cysteine ligase [[Clostridium] methylpentosum DSM 5476]MDY3989819.1 bifunctional phosphopantothenoylcysteine decarboxylase/phosphopantothenate--cysteine ligase CoaBC [Massilioclostridium sp.]